MNAKALLYIGAALPLVWGVSHLFPTKSVVSGFGDISTDNKHIITMEWITESVALIFIGVMVATVTNLDSNNAVSEAVYLGASACLVVLAVVSLFTGFRIQFLPFRLCPAIFISSATLITVGWSLL